MFQETKAMFLYCTSPVHMGAGVAVGGLIDNPIQRERHTDYPMIAGSGLKGAVRHDFYAQPAGKDEDSLLDRIFGPNGSDYAGAISFSDAQLVAFPVRCPRRAFVYATSPTALARAARLLAQAGVPMDWAPEPEIEAGACRVRNSAVLADDQDDQRLHLEAYELKAKELRESVNLDNTAGWLADNALPTDEAYRFFSAKLKSDLVLLSDDDFGYFVRNATVVEPHVRINDVSGTADEGGLFYTENLPPESLLISLIMASPERSGKNERLSASKVMGMVVKGDGDRLYGLHGRLIQVGGDATTGRGQVVVNIVGGAGDADA
ncbi:MAG: type III-B CRISPR module RAMP protein Cmr4 [Pseudomonadota bacterium]